MRPVRLSATARLKLMTTPQLVTAQMKLEARAHKDHDAAIALRLVKEILHARYGAAPRREILPTD